MFHAAPNNTRRIKPKSQRRIRGAGRFFFSFQWGKTFFFISFISFFLHDSWRLQREKIRYANCEAAILSFIIFILGVLIKKNYRVIARVCTEIQLTHAIQALSSSQFIFSNFFKSIFDELLLKVSRVKFEYRRQYTFSIRAYEQRTKVRRKQHKTKWGGATVYFYTGIL